MNTQKTLKNTLLLFCLPMLTATVDVNARPMGANSECARQINSHSDMPPPPHMSRLPMQTPMGMSGLPPFGMPPVPPDIKLDAGQEDKLFAIMYAEMPKMHEWMKNHRALMDEMQKTMNAPLLDENKIKVIADKLATLEKEQWLSRAKMQNQLFNLLSREQRELLLKNN
ncbi:MAG: Spy/CpxP family protein refolding chaperone [Methylophilus sp.]|nr:Spy/CpxP family protein refolding chaperone [Methylophilus sp.]